jgi:serine/threonine-protein kinase
MAPEQLAGAEVTARSDIYALGLVLYEVFTGQRALEGNNLAELIRKREQSGITPPSLLVRDLDQDIERAVMRCLRPEPEQRPPSALVVAGALPGGDPLAAALAAGETPSPEMVAAAGATGSLARPVGLTLMAFTAIGLLAAAVLADRMLIVNRIPAPKAADVLEERAREIRALAGYTEPPVDAVRGIGMTTEYLAWVSRQDRSPSRWDRLASAEVPLFRFWHRTSPRLLLPITTEWRPQLNDPPLAISGMVTVVVDERGRLVEMIAMPPQLDASDGPASPAPWDRMFAAAGLPFAQFAAVAPQWTPRVYADDRVAWEGPLPGHQDARVRVEAASYRGRPVAFQIVWPWTRPSRMEQPEVSARDRALSIAGGLLVLALLAGALALARENLRSGRADRRGARVISAVVFSAWVLAWLLGARQVFEIGPATGRFFTFAAFAILNTGFTWMFYLALEPFVRRLCPEILISWTRVLAGQLRDPRVGRDILIGMAAGTYVLLVTLGAPLVTSLVTGTPATPRATSVQYLLGFRHTASPLVRLVPNVLQTAMLTTFLYVVLLAVARRRWIVITVLLAIFTGRDHGGKRRRIGLGRAGLGRTRRAADRLRVRALRAAGDGDGPLRQSSGAPGAADDRRHAAALPGRVVRARPAARGGGLRVLHLASGRRAPATPAAAGMSGPGRASPRC